VEQEADTKARRGEAGSASLELVGVLPFLLAAVLVAAQLALAGASLWSAAVSARGRARAALVAGETGAVSARARVPQLLPGLPPLSVSARTRLGPDGG
jgi:hypothetical protein